MVSVSLLQSAPITITPLFTRWLDQTGPVETSDSFWQHGHMEIDEFVERLRQGEIVRVSTSDWENLSTAVEVIESHDTQMRGVLLVIKTTAGIAAVEEPDALTRAIRPLSDRSAASRFVAARMAVYERMWDGCGCKVDYFA
ncbi:MAG: hypothetical protein A2289_24580 [Deltaproteobacteria bacterium RIFOXYA12_FULL_58_15]|nr:MAG: hypothetical protein A2289_24580 [Deltaproteobacteria bacterium RIFOXYA12_FULL_58_15]OGR12715.1 MAG: hypothetical protein A2341_07840 [Deltaproteobacteria bacterium RIFOXYB12_FULL_58_9]